MIEKLAIFCLILNRNRILKLCQRFETLAMPNLRFDKVWILLETLIDRNSQKPCQGSKP